MCIYISCHIAVLRELMPEHKRVDHTICLVGEKKNVLDNPKIYEDVEPVAFFSSIKFISIKHPSHSPFASFVCNNWYSIKPYQGAYGVIKRYNSRHESTPVSVQNGGLPGRSCSLLNMHLQKKNRLSSSIQIT